METWVEAGEEVMEAEMETEMLGDGWTEKGASRLPDEPDDGKDCWEIKGFWSKVDDEAAGVGATENEGVVEREPATESVVELSFGVIWLLIEFPGIGGREENWDLKGDSLHFGSMVSSVDWTMRRVEGKSVNCSDSSVGKWKKANICDLKRESSWCSAKSSSAGVGVQISRGFALMYYYPIAEPSVL
jgi:hypothetical protein